MATGSIPAPRLCARSRRRTCCRTWCASRTRPRRNSSLALSGASGAKRALLSSYLRLRRRAGGCLIVCGWEGTAEAVERRRALSARVLRSGGAAALGGAPGRAWERGRYEGPIPHSFVLLRSSHPALGRFCYRIGTLLAFPISQPAYILQPERIAHGGRDRPSRGVLDTGCRRAHRHDDYRFAHLSRP